MRTRKRIGVLTFASGKPLPENVYRSNKWSKGDHSYRYKYPDGSFRKIPADTEEEIIRLAEEANNAVHQLTREKTANKNEERPYDDFSLGKWLDDFEQQFREDKTHACSADYLNNVLGSIRAHLKPIACEPVRKLTKQRLNSVWREMSYHAQKRNRSTLRRFVQFLLDFDVAPLLENRNPFWIEAAGGFAYKESPSEKNRGTMTMEVYKKIQAVAENKGYYFLMDAMDISFLTYLRVTDVVTLKFDEHVIDNHLVRAISKTVGRKKTKPVVHKYDLKVHTDLKAVISRARLRSKVGNKCPFIIHHSFNLYRTSAKKEHPNQVTRHYLNDCLNECMDNIKEFKNVPARHRPSFHEIRALRMAVDKLNREVESISKDMAHADTVITQSAYDTHNKVVEHTVSYAAKLQK